MTAFTERKLTILRKVFSNSIYSLFIIFFQLKNLEINVLAKNNPNYNFKKYYDY